MRPAEWRPAVETLAHPVRTFHTVRHLKPVQLFDRARRLATPIAGVPTPPSVHLRPRGPVRPARPAAGFDGAAFTFLNRRIAWGGDSRWRPCSDALWVYHLHYFQYLWRTPDRLARDLVADWIASNTNPRTIGWDPYPTSLRVREWIEWLHQHPSLEPAFRDAVARSITQQVEALRGRLEYHLLGNHLLENAIALCWAGVSFDGERAERWADEGLALLQAEIDRQVLSDGSHDERSPMYQALLADALLRLAEAAKPAPGGRAAAISRIAGDAGPRLAPSLANQVHPDGDYALLNDTALGMAPTHRDLSERYGLVPADLSSTWRLESAGYLGCRRGADQYLAFDAGPIGPDHQPGHGHADTLSFELSHRGERVITDTGVFTYSVGSAREADRSTAAHNTIEIDARDQCELWGAFRCARRPAMHLAALTHTAGGLLIAGRYVGPGKRLGSVSHHRQIFVAGGMLGFTDTLEAYGDHTARLRLHVAPGMTLRRTGANLVLRAGARRFAPSLVIGGQNVEWTEGRSPYHPTFGVEQSRVALEAAVSFRHSVTLKWWLLLS